MGVPWTLRRWSREPWKRCCAPRCRTPPSRCWFLQLGGISIIGMSVVGTRLGSEAAGPVLYMEQATGIVIGDPTKCVGGRRCELACTEFNDGKAAPSVARVKVARNRNFGPKGVQAGQRGEGNWGTASSCRTSASSADIPSPARPRVPRARSWPSRRRTPGSWMRICASAASSVCTPVHGRCFPLIGRRERR